MYISSNLINNITGKNWKYDPSKDVIIKNETIAGNMRPNINGYCTDTVPGNNFCARPMKHWRKQHVPVYKENGFTNTKGLVNTFSIPGGTNIVNNIVNTTVEYQYEPCKNQYVIPDVNITYRPKNDINNKIGHEAPKTFSDYTDFMNQCTTNHNQIEQCVSVCDPEKKARMKVRYPSAVNTDSSKPKYFQSNSSYLQARCRTYNQNNYQYGTKDVSKCENIVNPGAFRPNCQGCQGCQDNKDNKDNNVVNCNQKVSYYKPNNSKFAVQGGVSSGLRMDRLKYDTINNFANGFRQNPNFGEAVANAYAYSGKPEAPFTIKNKLFQCSPNTGKFRRTGNRQMKC
jgi:hypothetical protein